MTYGKKSKAKRSVTPEREVKIEEVAVPKYIIKKKSRVGLDESDDDPKAGAYVFYLDQLTIHKLGDEAMMERIKAPGIKWMGTTKDAFDFLTANKCDMGKESTGEPWCIVPSKQYPGIYFIGLRHDPDESSTIPYVLLTVDEIWLKSEYHQKQMYHELINDVKRICPQCLIVKSGSGVLQIRTEHPTPEQMALLELLPGIQKIGKPEPENPGKLCPDGAVWGAGGVPILGSQKALCLMSGGIDSPVAAYKMMIRGCHVDGVHYLNSTSETAAVMHKNRALAARLSLIQGTFTLRFIDIHELQTAIVGNVRSNNRTLVYKWFMLHLSAIMEDECKCLVTGDSLGQVASQTLANLAALYPGLRKPVLPPLMGLNKREIINIATKLGTYDASIIQAADCCQFMMQKNLANLCIDEWMLRGEIAKILRTNSVQKLHVTVDTFREGKLVSTTIEEFPFAEKVPTLCDIIDPEGAMRLGSLRRRRPRDDSAGDENEKSEVSSQGMSADTDEAPEKKFLPDDDQYNLAKKYFGDDSATKTKATPKATPEPAPRGRIFFDAAAGTMPAKEAVRAAINAPHGNPNSMHGSGRAARMAIERVRSQLGSLLGLPSSNIIFTSGGTESNNIALNGCRVDREAWSHSSTKGNLPEDQAHDPSIPLVKVVDLVHHETASIAPQSALKRPEGGRLHVDACQALGKIDIRDFDLSEVDTMTINSHKCHGPSGVGALYVRDLKSLKPLGAGGQQEQGIRPGTENVEGIVGFGAALELAEKHLLSLKMNPNVVPIHRQVEQFLCHELRSLGFTVNHRGPTSGYIIHATMPSGCKMTNMDFVTALSTKHQVEIGTGSACNTNTENTTTYETLGISPIPLKRSVRFSYDRYVSSADATVVIEAVKAVLSSR